MKFDIKQKGIRLPHLRTTDIIPSSLYKCTLGKWLDHDALNALLFYLMRNQDKTRPFLLWPCHVIGNLTTNLRNENITKISKKEETMLIWLACTRSINGNCKCRASHASADNEHLARERARFSIADAMRDTARNSETSQGWITKVAEHSVVKNHSHTKS